jgi:hypothetical protein
MVTNAVWGVPRGTKALGPVLPDPSSWRSVDELSSGPPLGVWPSGRHRSSRRTSSATYRQRFNDVRTGSYRRRSNATLINAPRAAMRRTAKVVGMTLPPGLRPSASSAWAVPSGGGSSAAAPALGSIRHANYDDSTVATPRCCRSYQAPCALEYAGSRALREGSRI